MVLKIRSIIVKTVMSILTEVTMITKEKLDSYIGKEVRVILFDNNELEGVLEYILEFSERYGYRKPGYYNIGNMGFKRSHIKRISEV